MYIVLHFSSTKLLRL